MNPYRQRVWTLLRELWGERSPVPRGLDFGSGDGWFARQFRTALADEITPVDVQPRPQSDPPAQLYDGHRLPFADRAFDLVTSVDVLHHCPDPAASLADALRCCGQYFLIKDHTYRTPVGYAALAVLDELGNRRFGIPSRYRYQHGWAWDTVLTTAGFRLRGRRHPAPCHVGPLGFLTNGLQFVALWERDG